MDKNEAKSLAKNSESDLISLNLIYDYPVRWPKYKVLRDFVQNFYDAVGYHEWHYRFSYEHRDDKLLFKTIDVDFSYDWLVHIGASTKRGVVGQYAGYFGEGFKIASLCALRDHGWNIEVVSRDWKLIVITTKVEVDGRYLTSLAYRVWRIRQNHKDTMLCISPFSLKDKELLECVLMSFFYPNNPLFGEEIWSSPEGAVFYRSSHPKPYGYPSTYDTNGEGIIFAGFQALGSFEYPLIFALHGFRINDRERNTFYKMDVIKVIRQTVEKLTPEVSAKVLKLLKDRWYDRPQKQYDFETYYSIIKALVHTVAKSPEEKDKWKKEYPNLLVAHQIKKSDLLNYNRRRQALAWLRSTEKKYRLVQDGFLASKH